MRRFMTLIVIGVSLVFSGCGTKTTATNDAATEEHTVALELSDKLAGGSRDLKEGLVIADDLVKIPRDQQVLIYYVNEPPEGIYRTLQQWTTEFDDAEVQKGGRRLEQDLQEFPAAVSHEIEAIQAAAPQSVGVVLFTNELVRDGQCLVKPIGAAAFQTVSFDRPDSEAADKRYHPVSDPAVLAAALGFVAGQFDPGEHDFVLVTKAHGSPDSAMATLFGHVMHAESAAQMMEIINDFRRQAAESKKIASSGERRDPGDSDVLDKDQLLDNDAMLNKDDYLANDDALANEDLLGKDDGTLANENLLANDDGLDGKALLSGMSKNAYFETLAGASRQHGMRFGIVFLEACRSELDETQSARLIASQPAEFIGILYASDQTGLRYTTIDYARLFDHAAENQLSLIAAVRHYLDEYQQTQEPIPQRGELPTQ